MRAGAAVGTLCIATTSVAAAAQAPETATDRSLRSARADLDVGGRDLHARAGRHLVVKGRGAARRVVRLQVREPGRWRTLGKARVKRDGRFRVRGRAVTPTRAKARVVSAGQRRGVGRVAVYRAASASWYGPGLYGGSLACGGTLTPGTLGVANKSLPCGAKVTLRKGRRSVTVPVVDRGPYVGGREYDLTAATARKLDFSGVGSVLTTR